MRTSIELDEGLLQDAMTISGLSTKQNVIHMALDELVKAYKRKKILEYQGKKIWEGNLEEMRLNR